MSYQLSFWKQEPHNEAPALGIYQKLLEGETVDGLVSLDTDRFLDRIATVFADWERMGPSFESPEPRGAFEAFTTAESITITCYGVVGTDMNRLIDVALEFDLPLFDPQTNERFG